MQTRDITIVGAGPAGLAAAIAAKRLGLDHVVLEKGVLVNSIYNFPRYMVFFTTPELLEIGELPLVSPYDKPTRLEALRYYRRVADIFDLRIEFGETVLSIDCEEVAGTETLFAVETLSALRSSTSSERPEAFDGLREPVDGRHAQGAPSESRGGVRRVRHSRTVILAIGYYDHPNLLDVPGEDLPHVSHYFTEPHGFYRQRVVIVGGGNSAAETALELFRAGAHVTLVHRQPALKNTIKYWVRPDIENRLKEGTIASRLGARVVEIRPTSVVVEQDRVTEELPADAVLLLTGYHPDADLLTRAGVRIDDETRVPQFDPETFESNIPGLFLAGGVISGRDTSGIFIENGRFHGETIVKVIEQRLAEKRE